MPAETGSPLTSPAGTIMLTACMDENGVRQARLRQQAIILMKLRKTRPSLEE